MLDIMNECDVTMLVVDDMRPELHNGATWIISSVGSPLNRYPRVRDCSVYYVFVSWLQRRALSD